MGDGEYNNLKIYCQDVETGEMKELHKISYLSDTESHENTKSNMFTVDTIMSMDLSPADAFRVFYLLFQKHFNNWRKQHGLRVLRRKHIYNKRWYGKIYE